MCTFFFLFLFFVSVGVVKNKIPDFATLSLFWRLPFFIGRLKIIFFNRKDVRATTPWHPQIMEMKSSPWTLGIVLKDHNKEDGWERSHLWNIVHYLNSPFNFSLRYSLSHLPCCVPGWLLSFALIYCLKYFVGVQGEKNKNHGRSRNRCLSQSARGFPPRAFGMYGLAPVRRTRPPHARYLITSYGDAYIRSYGL